MFHALDLNVLLFLNHWLANSGFARACEALLEDSPAILAPIVVVLWWTLPAVSNTLRVRALLLLAAQPLVYVIASTLQFLIHRPRPLLSVNLEIFDAKLMESSRHYFSHRGSFPSDHEALLFLLAAFVFSVNRSLGIACAVFGAFYAALRCGMGYHWPSDMLGGAAIAVLIAVVLLRLEPRLLALFNRVKSIPRGWAGAMTCFAFVYLADQFNAFGHSRDIARIVLHGQLFH